jgi:hypothetical protein
VDSAQRRLTELADAHLLVEPWQDGFVMHDLVRLFARDVLGGSGAERRTAALGRLMDHYLVACDRARRLIRPAQDGLDFAERSDVVDAPTTTGQALAWFDREWPNIVALVHAGSEAGLHEQVWQLVRLVHTYCLTRTVVREWVALVGFGLVSARVSGDELGEMLLLHAVHATKYKIGNLEESLPEVRRAHRIAVELGDPRYQVMTLSQLGAALAAAGEYEEALLHQWESIDLAKREGDQVGQATGLNNIAQVEQAMGRREVAVEHQFQAMEIYHRTGDERAFVLSVTNLAELYVELGRLREAEEYARQGVELARAGAMPFEEAFGRQVLGSVLARRGELVAAQAELTESLRLFEQVGSFRAMMVRTALEVLTSEV